MITLITYYCKPEHVGAFQITFSMELFIQILSIGTIQSLTDIMLWSIFLEDSAFNVLRKKCLVVQLQLDLRVPLSLCVHFSKGTAFKRDERS